jgi:hypothetical protein
MTILFCGWGAGRAALPPFLLPSLTCTQSSRKELVEFMKEAHPYLCGSGFLLNAQMHPLHDQNKKYL